MVDVSLIDEENEKEGSAVDCFFLFRRSLNASLDSLNFVCSVA
jgi:hypothetical protein